jgi:hypothetical protein
MTATAPPDPASLPMPPARQDDTGLGAVSPTAVAPFHGKHTLQLVAITLLGALLRFWHLGDWSIWVDEGHTWRDVTVPVDQFFGEAGSGRNWYPTAYLMLRWLMEHGWISQFSEGWLRLPFAFCGIVTVPLLALFGNLIVGRRAALLAALFLAINPWHIYWSQNARAYVMVCLFAVLAAGAFWLGSARKQPGWLVAAVVLALVGASCHATGLVLLPVFVVYELLSSRHFKGNRRWFVAIAAALGLTLLPWLLDSLPPFEIFQRAKPESQPSLLHLLQTTAFYFRVPLLTAAAIGVAMLFHLRMQGRVLFLACWALVPLLLLGIVGSTITKLTARYGLCALPAVLLLAAAASVRVGEALRRGVGQHSRWGRVLPAAFLPLLLCLDMVAYDYLYYTVQYGDRGRWREARELVLELADKRPLTVCTTNQPTLVYYLRPNTHRAPTELDPATGPAIFALVSWQVTDGGRYLDEVANTAVGGGREMFVVATQPELAEVDRNGSLRASIAQKLDLVTVLPLWVGPKDESIWIWRLKQRR